MGGVTGRAGPNWEVNGIALAQEWGLPWDRAPLRGNRDTLDTSGCLPSGFLVGFKAITRKGSQSFGAKISEAMDQCDRALLNLAKEPRLGGWGITSRTDGNGRLLIDCGGIIPVQVMQRSGYPARKAYVVTEYDYFLTLALERAKGRTEQ